MITQAIQDYLKIIYKLGAEQKPVNTNAISDRMCIAQGSVTGMLKKLAELNLITYTPYHGVRLTDAGKNIALEIIRHHRLLELYLAEALGYSWDRVHDEAEKLEHHISEEFEDRVAEFLGNPDFDPHGAPIPSKDGTLPDRLLAPLDSAQTGSRVRVEQVSDSDPEILRYLGNLGIFPTVELDVLERIPFGSTLLVQIGGTRYHLGEKLTQSIMISKISNSTSNRGELV